MWFADCRHKICEGLPITALIGTYIYRGSTLIPSSNPAKPDTSSFLGSNVFHELRPECSADRPPGGPCGRARLPLATKRPRFCRLPRYYRRKIDSPTPPKATKLVH